MTDPDSLFDDFASALAKVLEAQGFRLRERMQSPQSIGSRLVQYARGTQEVRLLWDGRERWFLIQQRGAVLHGQEDEWNDIAFERYEPTRDPPNGSKRFKPASIWLLGTSVAEGGA
jgi:hypothetical protein